MYPRVNLLSATDRWLAVVQIGLTMNTIKGINRCDPPSCAVSSPKRLCSRILLNVHDVASASKRGGGAQARVTIDSSLMLAAVQGCATERLWRTAPFKLLILSVSPEGWP